VLAPAWPTWLGERPAELPALKALLAPYPSDEMIAWPVSPRVGNVKNYDPSLTSPLRSLERYDSCPIGIDLFLVQQPGLSSRGHNSWLAEFGLRRPSKVEARP
jgi:hypothetical protein